MSDKQTAVSTAELMRRAEADAARRDWHDHLEREEQESPDTEEARWSGILGRMKYERPEVFYLNPTPDRRLHDRDAAIADGLLRDEQTDGAA